jgi:hypothetical protein
MSNLCLFRLICLYHLRIHYSFNFTTYTFAYRMEWKPSYLFSLTRNSSIYYHGHPLIVPPPYYQNHYLMILRFLL